MYLEKFYKQQGKLQFVFNVKPANKTTFTIRLISGILASSCGNKSYGLILTPQGAHNVCTKDENKTKKNYFISITANKNKKLMF